MSCCCCWRKSRRRLNRTTRLCKSRTGMANVIRHSFIYSRTGPSSGSTPLQGAANPLGGTSPSSPAGSQPNGHSSETAVGPHTGGLPFASSSVLPARPNLPDDPVIPHNGFTTVEEGEKAFIHLLRKAGVDANWTWDQTMRAIITDPLYKALNTLAEKKAGWQKVSTGVCVNEVPQRVDWLII